MLLYCFIIVGCFGCYLCFFFFFWGGCLDLFLFGFCCVFCFSLVVQSCVSVCLVCVSFVYCVFLVVLLSICPMFGSLSMLKFFFFEICLWVS